LTEAERQTQRAALGIDPGQFVFLNLGATFWNKGVDVLLLAYATLRQKHSHLRLMLKDQEGVYGIGIDNTLTQLRLNHPALFTADTLASISTIKKNLSQTQLRSLYALADCYVSTYRAEGFNLPVLEAMACGTPVVVTKGGATDDFCPPGLALFVEGQPTTRPPDHGRKRCFFLEPSLDAAIHAMERMALEPMLLRGPQAELARLKLTHRFSWAAAAQQLLGWAQAQGARAPDVASAGTWPLTPLQSPEITAALLAKDRHSEALA
jgi:glycosyltransferase involved in cell wall biosynthesis